MGLSNLQGFFLIVIMAIIIAVVGNILDKNRVKDFDELCKRSCGELYATECNFKDVDSADFVLVSWCENLSDGKVTNHTYMRAELLDFR